jgi:Uma2 family endonuclease
VSPAPVTIHQRVLHRLEVLLEAACPPEFELLPGPGVVLSEIQYRIPDLVVVRADTVGFAHKNVTRPPELVVEIASPSTAHYDRAGRRLFMPNSAFRATGSWCRTLTSHR